MNKRPTHTGIKQFGLAFSAAATFWLSVYWIISARPWVHIWPFVFPIGLFLLIVFLAPLRLTRFYLLWMKLATRLNRAVVTLLLSLIFFLLILPIAIFRRLLGNDILQKPDYMEGTYRQTSLPLEAEDMENPF